MKLPPGHVAGQGVVKPKCTGGFGERMLRTMGWASGQGLGREAQGIVEAIQVKKKEDTVGVGGNGSYDWANKWWEKAFDSAVDATQGHAGSDSSDSSDSNSDDSEGERMAAIAATVNRDGTRTSASADELKLLASLSKGGGRVAAGRFGGRDAKMARIRQQEASMAAAAEAKLGGASSGAAGGTPTAAAAAAAGQLASDRSDTISEVKLSSGSSKKRKGAAAAAAPAAAEAEQSSGKEGKKARKAKAAAAAAGDAAPDQQEQEPEQPVKKQRIVIEPKVKHVGPKFEFTPTPATGWWGDKRFASAGCLEGLDTKAAEAARQRVTFNEDMQENIYKSAQAKKTQGKVGLGQGTGTVKVGGVKWEGKKVSFDDPEGGTEVAAQAAAAAAGGDAAAGGKARLAAIAGSSTHLDALPAAEQQQQAAAPAGAAKQQQEEGEWAAAVKWKKIITQQLSGAAQQPLKLKELQRLVVAAVLEKHGSAGASKAAVKAALGSHLEGSSKFALEGKLVHLRS